MVDLFAGKVAIVTGGASGIGHAVAEALLQRGAAVVLADVDGVRVQGAAAEMVSRGGRAEAVTLDVRDEATVRALVDDVVQRHGKLDFIFNNAGIALFGEVRDMTSEQWTRMIDVNLRGVVNGVNAAYPVMIRQGHGHIVNTASAAGLAPAPGATAYAMTKHAVVGLSTSLRAEAALFGVRVSVVCPGLIDTPLKNSLELLNTDRETLLGSFPLKLHAPEMCARAILRGIERNKSIIVVTGFAKVGWLLYRLAPELMTRLVSMVAKRSPILGRA